MAPKVGYKSWEPGVNSRHPKIRSGAETKKPDCRAELEQKEPEEVRAGSPKKSRVPEWRAKKSQEPKILEPWAGSQFPALFKNQGPAIFEAKGPDWEAEPEKKERWR